MERPPAEPNSPIARIADELKHIGEINVSDWDFVDLLRKDIADLELSRSIRRLGSIRVTDWDFKDVLPAVDRIAHKEVDLGDLFRRTANYRVTDWDFRSIVHRGESPSPRPRQKEVAPETMRSIAERSHAFLRYLVDELAEHPDEAEIEVFAAEQSVLTALVRLAGRDAAVFIGRGGHAAETVRRVLQMAALRHGVHVLLRVSSRDDDPGGKAKG